MNTQHNMAEMAAIGLLLLYPQQAGGALGLLRAEMFEAQPLADIFRCIRRMHAEGREWDGAAVAGALGPQYNELVMQCAACTGSAHQLGSYAAIVRRAWRERTLKAAALELAAGGQDADGITEAMRALVRGQDELACEEGGAGASFAQCAAAALAGEDGGSQAMQVPGWHAFNRATGGLAQKGVYVIAARPGRGKTDFALQMAVMLAARWRVHYFSMEMTACQLARRVLSRVCGIQAEKLRDGTLSPGEREAAQQVAARFDELHLTVDDAAAVGMEQLERAVARHRPQVVFLDHIGLMKTRARLKRSEELAGLTRALKEFAMRRGVAVVELVQAARESEGRRMYLRDMFGSATIEQDADGVLALEPQGEGAASGGGSRDVRVSVLKWREGVACELHFAWQPQFHRFWPAGP